MIVDEVATGFGRTGRMFACEHEDVAPDLMCLAKGITGGYLPLAATLATERIYEGFLGAFEEFRTFFHGHTYTGNPLACAAALANLDVFEQEHTIERLQPKIALLEKLLPSASPASRRCARCASAASWSASSWTTSRSTARMGHQVTLEARRRGAIVRPLGDTVVLMPPLGDRRRPTCAGWSTSPRTRSRRRPARAIWPRPPPQRPPRRLLGSPSAARRTRPSTATSGGPRAVSVAQARRDRRR